MTLDEFFDELPSQELREITNEDYKKVLVLAESSVKIFKADDNTLTKEEKVEQYKIYCKKLFNEAFSNLSYESKVKLDTFFTLYGSHFILEHLNKK